MDLSKFPIFNAWLLNVINLPIMRELFYNFQNINRTVNVYSTVMQQRWKQCKCATCLWGYYVILYMRI